MTEKGRGDMGKFVEFDTVWGDLQDSKNIELLFNCNIELANTTEREIAIELVAKDIYNLFVNDVFVSYGPARTAKGYARVERLDLGSCLKAGDNIISIYVQSVSTKTSHIEEGAPFVGVRVLVDGEVMKTTKDFTCQLVTDRLQKVERMSSQRGYVEVYQVEGKFPTIPIKKVACPILLERRAPYLKKEVKKARRLLSGGVAIDYTKKWENEFTRRLDTGNKLDGYSRKECDCVLSKELLSFTYKKEQASEGLSYCVYELDEVYSGKFAFRVRVKEPADVWVTYDALLKEGYVQFNREHIIHGLKWTLPAGEHKLYSQEVYDAKYIQLITDEHIEIEEVAVICVDNPQVQAFPVPPMEEALHTIVRAAKNSLAQNAYDVYTDCVTRERGGWLCDSYFMGKAEHFFTGDCRVEKDFLENFLLYDGAAFRHKGIVPMCYPSQPTDAESFIPTWILWYVLELEDYRRRTKDAAFIKRHRERFGDILDYFKGFENEYGLLENLEGWVFVEWSKASEFVDGVNIPINILYAETNRAVGEMLGDVSLIEKSKRLKDTIREMAFDGQVYRDNAVRVDGRLQITENVSEYNQTIAAYFKMEEEGTRFYQDFVERFQNIEREVCPAALFVGSVLRQMTLYEMGEYTLLLEECKEHFLEMAETTGTIWELFGGNASCNHGFGAVIGKIICEAVQRLQKQKGEGYEKA